MTWRVAESLEVLRGEVNEIAPGRLTVSDGSIGDAAHASRTSDHNPWVIDENGVGVVRARDFTHDPVEDPGGLPDLMDAGWLAHQVANLLGIHPALGSGAYVIWNHQIISTSRLDEGWRPYVGSNAHEHHVHVSVGLDGYDSTAPWLTREDWFDMATKDELREVVREEIAKIFRDDDSIGRARVTDEKTGRTWTLAQLLWSIKGKGA